MLKFTKVKLHNFLSYKDAELELDNQGVTLIEGVNNSNDAYTSSGSGKSSLLSAITYALYGKTVTGLTSNAVINKEAGTDCYVELYFNVDKSKYCIKRFRKGKQGNANKVRLYLNNDEITEATNPKTDKAIQDLIGIEFNTYINTISYGSSDEPVFSQATDKGKKEILENLANTGIYAKARDYASSKLKEFKLSLTTAEQEVVNHENMIDKYQELEKQDKERYEKEQTLQNENKQALERLKSDRDNYAKESEKQLVGLKSAHSELLKQEPQPDFAGITEWEEKLDKTNNAINKLKVAINTKNATLNNLRQQYKDLKSKTVCPVCGQRLDEEHKQKELNKIAVQGKEADAYVAKCKTAGTKLVAIQSSQRTKVNALKKQVSAFNQRYKAYQDKMRDLNNKIANIQVKNKEYDMKVSALSSNSAVDIVSPKCYTNDIKTEQEKLVKAKAEVTDLTKKIDNYTILVDKVFSKEGITSVVLDLITPYLNEHANYYLTKLSGSILSINMNTQKLNANHTLSDRFDLRVHNQAGADSYQNCSAGERKRIDIAIAFAIQDLQQDHANTATNIAIYDECFDGLDSIGCESVIDILKEKAKTIPSIFVITHNDTLKPLFDNSIKVTKSKQGISSIGV